MKLGDGNLISFTFLASSHSIFKFHLTLLDSLLVKLEQEEWYVEIRSSLPRLLTHFLQREGFEVVTLSDKRCILAHVNHPTKYQVSPTFVCRI